MRTEIVSAGEVAVGNQVLYGGEPRTVLDVRFLPPREDEWERQMKIHLDGDVVLRGDEGQTVTRVVAS